MNTDKTLQENFINVGLTKWQTKVLEAVDIDYVIWNLLKEQFVVEIDGHKYDITFGKNRKHEIGTAITLYPSPAMCSYEIINKGFTTGKWFRVTTIDLPQQEICEHIQTVQDMEEQNYQEWLLNCAKTILNNNQIAYDKMSQVDIVMKLKSLLEHEFKV